MASARRHPPRCSPLTYSEYTRDVLRVLPPNIAIPEHINNNSNNNNNNNNKTNNNNNNNSNRDDGSNKSYNNRKSQLDNSCSSVDGGADSKRPLNKLNNPNMIVVVNVTGTRFELSRHTYSKLEPAILKSRDTTLVQINPNTGCTEIFIERHPACFAAILDYYRWGELHMPSDICPSLFKRELSFWQISCNAMEPCCLRRYAAFHSNEQTLSNCQISFTQWKENKSRHPTTRLGRYRRKGWAIMDDPKSGPLAKAYFCVATFFVVLSIFLMAAYTDKTFNRELNADEWEEFMSDDELYAYWDRIYPGKEKPDRNYHTGTSTVNSQPPVANLTAPSGGGGLPGNPVGKRKRSVPDGPRYTLSDLWDRENSPGDEEEDHLQRIIHGFQTQNNEENDFQRRFSDLPGEEDETDEGVASKILSFHFRNGVKTMLNKIIKDKDAKNVDSLTNLILNQALKSHKEMQRNRMEIKLEKLKNTPKSNGQQHSQENPNLKNESDHRSSPTESRDDHIGREPLQYNDERQQLHHLLDDRIEQGIRHRRSVGWSNDTGNWDDWNETSSSTNATLNRIYNKNCLVLSGADLHFLVAALTEVAVVLSYDNPELPPARTVYSWVDTVDYVCMAYFTVEFILRIAFAPNLVQFFFSFLTVMDLISLITMYIAVLAQYFVPELKYKDSAMDAVHCFQITRVFRFFRLVKDVTGFRVLLLSVKTSWKELVLLLLYIIMAVTIFATIAFFCERDNMKSIPEAAWWAIVTMTTVGYGDITPKSLQGRLTGMACAMSGVLLIAVTVPIFVNNFILFYEYSQINLESEWNENSPTGNDSGTLGVDSNENDGGLTHRKKHFRLNESNPKTPDGKLFRESSSESNTTDNGPDSIVSPAPWTPNTNQAFEMDNNSVIDGPSSGSSAFSRTNSCKSLLSLNTGSVSKGRHPSSSNKNPETRSTVTMSKVTPFVYDLELEKDGGNDVSVIDNKPAVERRKNKNNIAARSKS